MPDGTLSSIYSTTLESSSGIARDPRSQSISLTSILRLKVDE
ncbi:hypothetical protein ACHAXN_000350 [Cyclotella atomus]